MSEGDLSPEEEHFQLFIHLFRDCYPKQILDYIRLNVEGNPDGIQFAFDMLRRVRIYKIENWDIEKGEHTPEAIEVTTYWGRGFIKFRITPSAFTFDPADETLPRKHLGYMEFPSK